jgi:hypothetical protein
VAHLPRLDLDAEEAIAAGHGRVLGPAGITGPYAVFRSDATLIGVYEDVGPKARPLVTSRRAVEASGARPSTTLGADERGARSSRATFALRLGRRLPLIVVGIFVYAIPKFADYAQVWKAITTLTPIEMGTLIAATIFNLFTYWWANMAALPGLRLWPRGGRDPDDHIGRQHAAGWRRDRDRIDVLDPAFVGSPALRLPSTWASVVSGTSS